MSSLGTSSSVRLTGRVKWFNNKTGFGFITIVGGNEQFKDASEIFTHHSAVKVSQEQYRYLVEGEYVEFSVTTTDSGDHKFQAADVRGVKGGKLFCETRHEQRVSHDNGENSDRGRQRVRGGGVHHDDGGHSSGGGRVDSGRGRGRGGDSSRGRGGRGEWMLVRKDAAALDAGSGSGSGSGRGGGRIYSSRPSGQGQRQPRTGSGFDSSMSESFSAPVSAPAPAPAPAPASTTSPSAEPSDVPATPRASTTRKPRQSKPSS